MRVVFSLAITFTITLVVVPTEIQTSIIREAIKRVPKAPPTFGTQKKRASSTKAQSSLASIVLDSLL